MAPPKQSNTIDFDAAKQKRGPQPGGNASGPRASNLTELRQQLTLQLQSSLEAERILGLFFEEVRQLIPLDALGYRHPGSDLRLEFGSSAKHSVSYRLSHDSDYLGELIFRRRQRLGEDEQRQLESLLGTLLFPLRNALLYRAAIRTALRDALTGTGNRIAMDQALGRELELARRNLQPLSVLMLDIDHFKRVNDHYGHAVGDEALKAVAETIKDHLRNVDMAFRFGGEGIPRPAVQHAAAGCLHGRRTPAPGGGGTGLPASRRTAEAVDQPRLRRPAARRRQRRPAATGRRGALRSQARRPQPPALRLRLADSHTPKRGAGASGDGSSNGSHRRSHGFRQGPASYGCAGSSGPP